MAPVLPWDWHAGNQGRSFSLLHWLRRDDAVECLASEGRAETPAQASFLIWSFESDLESESTVGKPH